MFTPVTHPSRKTVLRRNRVNKVIREMPKFRDENDTKQWIERIKEDPYRTFPWE